MPRGVGYKFSKMRKHTIPTGIVSQPKRKTTKPNVLKLLSEGKGIRAKLKLFKKKVGKKKVGKKKDMFKGLKLPNKKKKLKV